MLRSVWLSTQASALFSASSVFDQHGCVSFVKTQRRLHNTPTSRLTPWQTDMPF